MSYFKVQYLLLKWRQEIHENFHFSSGTIPKGDKGRSEDTLQITYSLEDWRSVWMVLHILCQCSVLAESLALHKAN